MNWRHNIDNYYAMKAKVIKDKKDREIVPIETLVENMGHFTNGVTEIHSIQAQDRFRDFKPVYFSLCNPYKAFGKLGLIVIEDFGKVNENVFLYAAKDDENKYTLIELSFYKEKIKLIKV